MLAKYENNTPHFSNIELHIDIKNMQSLTLYDKYLHYYLDIYGVQDDKNTRIYENRYIKREQIMGIEYANLLSDYEAYSILISTNCSDDIQLNIADINEDNDKLYNFFLELKKWYLNEI